MKSGLVVRLITKSASYAPALFRTMYKEAEPLILNPNHMRLHLYESGMRRQSHCFDSLWTSDRQHLAWMHGRATTYGVCIMSGWPCSVDFLLCTEDLNGQVLCTEDMARAVMRMQA